MSEQEFNRAMGEWLRKQRKRFGLSQDALAVSIGIHRNTIHRWEKGDPLSAWDYKQLQKEFKRLETEEAGGEVVWSLERGKVYPLDGVGQA